MNLDNPIWKVWLSSNYDYRAEFIQLVVEHYGENLKHFCEICERGKGDDTKERES